MVFYTIGHSNQAPEQFEELLRKHGITAVADVRSQPYSRYAVDFNREVLARRLPAAGIAYVFLGDAVGGRPSDRRFYDPEDHVLYGEMAESPDFLAGIVRLEEGARKHRVVIMCSEENPADCHRHRLIARVLVGRGHEVRHIRKKGDPQSAAALLEQQEAETSQMGMFAGGGPVLWRSTQSVSPSAARSSSSKR